MSTSEEKKCETTAKALTGNKPTHHWYQSTPTFDQRSTHQSFFRTLTGIRRDPHNYLQTTLVRRHNDIFACSTQRALYPPQKNTHKVPSSQTPWDSGWDSSQEEQFASTLLGHFNGYGIKTISSTYYSDRDNITWLTRDSKLILVSTVHAQTHPPSPLFFLPRTHPPNIPQSYYTDGRL